MKKFFKYSFYGLIYLIIILFMAVMFIVTTAKADLIKPNTVIEPDQVVLIQLNGLKKNGYVKSKAICYTYYLSNEVHQIAKCQSSSKAQMPLISLSLSPKLYIMN